MPTNSASINIMIRGIGGQGVKLAGTIMGKAAINSGYSAVQAMKYGSAITGGETRSEIKISKKKIIYPKIVDIDIYIALTQDDLDNYFESKLYIVALNVAKAIPKEIQDNLIKVPIFEIAEKLGNTQVANTVLIGLLVQLFDIATPESTIKAIEELTNPRFHEINIRAFEEGLNLDLSDFNSSEILSKAGKFKLK